MYLKKNPTGFLHLSRLLWKKIVNEFFGWLFRMDIPPNWWNWTIVKVAIQSFILKLIQQHGWRKIVSLLSMDAVGQLDSVAQRYVIFIYPMAWMNFSTARCRNSKIGFSSLFQTTNFMISHLSSLDQVKFVVLRNGNRFWRGKFNACDMLEYHQETFSTFAIEGIRPFCPFERVR